MRRVTFTRMQDGTAEDYHYLEGIDEALNHSLPDDLIALMQTTHRETGYAVSPMEHAIQTATRASRDGAEEEMVVAALFHDIADKISPMNHAQVGAAILRPYIGERTHWILAHHNLFQRYYYWDKLGRDPNDRERYRGHPHFEACAEFCERWDSVSFDPNYDSMPLDAFRPIVHRVLSREPYALWPNAPR